ncbi:MAG: 16S rRNA (cytosine(1402)-N(4))-methyltransferase RsmH [Clostridia bacterium]|nr:16S rRNA (cytosine(1402)-N(4))-methyltransferase RsmH [Clostridia bacterium]
MPETFSHYSVMLEEAVRGLNVKKNGLYVDCTAGGGGHSFAIASRLDPEEGGRLIAIDRDADAIEAVKKRLSTLPGQVWEAENDNFSDLKEILGGRQADGILMDLGVSSYQLDCPERGFSYITDAPLDMRMDREQELTAYDVVNGYEEKRLADLIFAYGEERFSRRIAAAIVSERRKTPIESTLRLAEIVSTAIPHREKNGHPARRTFQAIRIEVNGELNVIEPAVRTAAECLSPGGRLCVITFHSLEDRIVKNVINDLSTGCVCPPGLPVCVCGRKPVLEKVTKKPLTPSERELSENRRSHSAKMRIAEKI